MPMPRVPPPPSPRLESLLSAAEIAALRISRDRMQALSDRLKPRIGVNASEWNADLDAMKIAVVAIGKIIDAKPCRAYWSEGLLSPPGELERPSGWCELGAGHEDDHLFPNGNRQP